MGELAVRWTCVVVTPTTRTLGLSRKKQGRKVEHLVKATSGDGAKMRGTEPTLLGPCPKLLPIRKKEELLLPIRNNQELLLPIRNNQELLPPIHSQEELLPPNRNNQELSKTRHQRAFHLASCQPGLRGISRRRSLKRV